MRDARQIKMGPDIWAWATDKPNGTVYEYLADDGGIGWFRTVGTTFSPHYPQNLQMLHQAGGVFPAHLESRGDEGTLVTAFGEVMLGRLPAYAHDVLTSLGTDVLGLQVQASTVTLLGYEHNPGVQLFWGDLMDHPAVVLQVVESNETDDPLGLRWSGHPF